MIRCALTTSGRLVCRRRARYALSFSGLARLQARALSVTADLDSRAVALARHTRAMSGCARLNARCCSATQARHFRLHSKKALGGFEAPHLTQIFVVISTPRAS